MNVTYSNGAIPDIRAVIGNATTLHRKTRNELEGPCPWCGGKDRFTVSLKTNRWWCRKCSPNEHWSDAYEFVQKYEHVSFPVAKAKLDGTTLPPPPPILPPLRIVDHKDRGPIVATYDYTDEEDTLLYQVCRHDPKSFSQRRPCSTVAGGWIYNLESARRVLYRLPELLAEPQRVVWIVEGEKDADTLASWGLLGTTNAGGATNWRPEYTEALRGRRVIILPDQDDAGTKHTASVVEALNGVAASTLVVPLPAKDVTAWAEAGGTRAELEARVVAALKPAPIFPGEIGADELALMHFPPPVAYVPGILYEGATLYAAPPKSGKSISTLGMCVAIASGGAVFGKIKVPKRRVLYFSLEDPIELVQERLFTMMQGRPFPPLLRIFQTAPALADMHLAIEQHVARFPDTGVVVIDTLAHARGATPRSNKDIVQQDYQELIGFSHLAHKLHIAIVIITHTAKAQYDDELAQVSGTFGLSGAVDAIMILARKRHSPEATLALFSRRLGSEKKYELHWEESMLSYVLDGEMAPEKAARTTSTAIIDCLQGATGPLSIRAVAELCQLSYEVAKQRLWQLFKSNEIIKTDEGKYSLPQYVRNPRNFVTVSRVNEPDSIPFDRNQERNQMADDEEDSGPGDGNEDSPDEDATVTDCNQSHQSNGYEVTAVTPKFVCRECGYRMKKPAAWDEHEFICARCFVSEKPIPF